ncbi:MAG: hypothetical protein HWE16_17375 [Gammaproteobacteria bacterium]|nr:hypothetical protein [Gammaproteobacteria bacterium]
MSKGRLSSVSRGLIAYSLFSIGVIVIFNLYIFKDNQQDYSNNQQNTANSLITAIEARVELPLLVADNETIQAELSKIELAPDIILVEVKDNKDALVASKYNSENGSGNINEQRFMEKNILNKPDTTDFEDIFSDDTIELENQIIGSVKVYLNAYDALSTYRNNSFIVSYNLLLIVLMIFMAYLYFKQAQVQKKKVNQISSMLADNKLSYFEQSTSSELNELYSSAAKAVDRLSKQSYQLANLKQEIQYAREDSNLELHKFLEFLINSKKVELDENLTVFSQSVLSSRSEEKSLVNIGRSLSSAIAMHSELLSKNNVTVFDNILNKLQDFSVFLDRKLFHQFLNLLVEQLIQLCKNSEINVNADINRLQDDSNILRLSFESSSPAFKKALEMQSLFEFVPQAHSNIGENNSSFIACKHLVQKAGGDYIFLKEEIRFEFPVLIEKNYVATSNLSLIKPLEEKRSILVFDSDPTERIVLMGYLTKFGQNADKATTKQVVLQKLRHNHFDILCVNSEFFSDQDPYFLTNFKSEYLAIENPPLLLVISSNKKIIKNDYFKSFNAKLLHKPIDLKQLERFLIQLT